MGLDRRAVLIASSAVVGAGLAYYVYKTTSRKRVVTLALQVESTHVTWVQEMATKYSMDATAVVKQLVQYCETASLDGAAETIFNEKRCNTCGAKDKVDMSVSITGGQLQFIDNMTAKYAITKGRDKALRVMFEFAMNDVEDSTIFAS